MEKSAERTYCENLAFKALEEYLPLRLEHDRLIAEEITDDSRHNFISRMTLIVDTVNLQAKELMLKHAPDEAMATLAEIKTIFKDSDFKYSKLAGLIDDTGKPRADMAQKPKFLPTEKECMRVAVNTLKELFPLREEYDVLLKHQAHEQADKLLDRINVMRKAAVYRCSNELQWAGMDSDMETMKAVKNVMDDKDRQFSRSLGLTPKTTSQNIDQPDLFIDLD